MFFRKKIWHVLITFLITVTFCSSVFAESLQDKLDDLKQQANDKQTEINSAKSKTIFVIVSSGIKKDTTYAIIPKAKRINGTELCNGLDMNFL